MSDNITKGDDVQWPVQLLLDSATFVIDPGAQVRAALTRRGVTVGPVVTCSSGTAGADWATSLIVVVFTAAETSTMTTGQTTLEIEIVDGGITSTFRVPGVAVLHGVIV